MRDVGLQDTFSEIYARDEWHGGSGEGSLAEHNAAYVAFLERYLHKHRVRTVVDLGCGDWQTSRNIDWGRVRYIGLDVVGSVISANRAQFGSRRVTFDVTPDEAHLPDADLLIVKDVLQHWSDQRVAAFRTVLAQFAHVIVTNCIGVPGQPRNIDIADGAFRPIDLRAEPYGWTELVPAFCFTNADAATELRWVKQVLIRG